MNRVASIAIAVTAGALFSPVTLARAADTKPNIVVILADDLGNADLGYRGSDIKTPNIDKLAQDGVRLDSFYGMPVCTPSRAELMTGRYAMRYGLETLVIFPSHTYGLPTDERTLPQALKDAGYDTAMVGKWHLGHADQKYWPQNRGFDHFYGNLVGEVDYFTKERGGIVDWQRDGKFLKEDGYYTDLIGNEAVSIIDHHDTAKPLFLYVASLAPHAPYQAPQELDRRLQGSCRRYAPAYLRRHDHRPRHASRTDRRRAQAEGHARQHAHHLLAATMAARPAPCSRRERAPRKSVRKAAALGSRRSLRPRTANFAAAKARCTKAACAFRPSFIGRPSSSRGSWMSRWLWST